MTSKLHETISALDFGADPTGTTDTSTALQSWLTYLVSRGGCGRLPAGHYKCGTGLVIDKSTMTDITDLTRVSIVGDGSGCTLIDFTGTNSAALTYQGSAASIASLLNIEGIQFNGYSLANTIGLLINFSAFCTIKDCFFHGFINGVVAQDVLSSYFQGNVFQFNTVALIARIATETPPNAISFYSNVFGNSSQNGVQLINCTSIDFRGGSIEGNAYDTLASSRCGVQITNNNDTNGAVAVNFDGVYFELNGGVGDIWFTAGFTANPTSLRVTGCNFNRVGPTGNATNNIRVNLSAQAAKTWINLSGNGHRGFNGYVPDASTPYVDIVDTAGANWNVVDIGNLYESDIEKPVIPGPVKSSAAMASCWCSFNGITAGIQNSFNVGSLVRNSVGDYTITFERPLATNLYSFIATVVGVGNAYSWSPQTSTVNFRSSDPSGTLTDFGHVDVVIFGGGDIV